MQALLNSLNSEINTLFPEKKEEIKIKEDNTEKVI